MNLPILIASVSGPEFTVLFSDSTWQRKKFKIKNASNTLRSKDLANLSSQNTNVLEGCNPLNSWVINLKKGIAKP